MTSTNVSDFKILLSKIPDFKNVWFFPLRQDRKNPDVPSGTVLKGNTAYRLSVRECISRLKQGKNVGIYALNGGLMFLDLDVENGKLKASNEFLNKIIPSFCVKTRNGGLQYYYINDGRYANQVIKENDKEIGELRTDWYYVVAAGSYVKTDENNCNGDGTYRVINNSPISPFSGLDDYIVKKDDVEKKDIKTFHKKTEDKGIDIEDYKKELVEKRKIKRLLSKEGIKYMIDKYKR